jgi:hypothetical protein
MFGWHYLLWTWIDGDRRPEYRQQVLERGQSFINSFLHFFGANGSYPAWGRSIVYRFAAVAPFAVGHFLKIAPDDPGLLRRVSSGCIRYFYDRGLFDPEHHFVRQGYHGDFPAAGEAYISPGSPYWCCHGLFALTFDRDDPFWRAIESPLPVERADFELVLPAPGLVLSGRKETGQVLLLNSCSGQEHDAPRHNYTSKYGKLAYSTHFPFNVLPIHGSYAPDTMVSLTRDGRTFGHRLHTRAGAVAPGLIWSKFDEIVDDELQPLWVGVMLWGDVQIRLTAIRPTLPVMAYEAPGALGSDEPKKIVRRSDVQSGWEYAEADGRAIAIQRLFGYDCQSPSAPFLDQSNINLAYTYSEQPVIYEAQANLAARWLASASLVRPAPFDPTKEFADIKVEIESPEIFRVSLPGRSEALVAPGETTPKHATIQGMEVEGIGMRYVRVSKDLDDICGLGVIQIPGLIRFYEPATFHAERTSDRAVRMTTDKGFSLNEAWLGGPACCIEIMTLDNQWLEVTDQSQSGSIPPHLVQEWSDRNQRTLVDFRISI